MRRVLVVNADDFGRSHGINRGVALAHDRGIVTSASAMVHWPTAEDAAEIAHERPALGVGLHVDLGEWLYRDGEWCAVYTRVSADRSAVAEEVETQLDRFRSLFGRHPTHLDSHQNLHREEPLLSILVDTGRRLEVPVRGLAPGVAYRGDFYGQTSTGEPLPDAVSVEALLDVLSSLAPGITELGCHPGFFPEACSTYAAERPRELRALCDPRTQAFLEAGGIELRSFDGIAALAAGGAVPSRYVG